MFNQEDQDGLKDISQKSCSLFIYLVYYLFSLF